MDSPSLHTIMFYPAIFPFPAWRSNRYNQSYLEYFGVPQMCKLIPVRVYRPASMSTIYKTPVWYGFLRAKGETVDVLDLRLRLQQLSQWGEPVETFPLGVGEFPPKVDSLDLSCEREALIR